MSSNLHAGSVDAGNTNNGDAGAGTNAADGGNAGVNAGQNQEGGNAGDPNVTPNPSAQDLGGKTMEQLQAEATAKYTPNFKFKASDKEHEFDDVLKGLIKDQTTEAKVRELYEKAHGLDAVKQNRQELRTENRSLKEELGSFQNDVAELQHYYKQGDLDSFFQKLQVPEEVVYKWVVDKAKLKELPPEQQAVYEEKRQAQLKMRSLEQQIQALQEGRDAAEGQSKVLSLQQEFSRQDVQTFAKAFDSKMGKENAFWDAVCELGEYVYLKSDGRQNLTPTQAVKQAMEAYSKFIDPSQLGGATPGNPAQAAPAAASAVKPPVKVIPNVGGNAASPTARKIKTLDELKEFAKNFPGSR